MADADVDPASLGLNRRAAIPAHAVTASEATRPSPGGAEFKMP
jgi:hypothetical protein